jgi:rare lipoprotein A (peptidoglycan hydrolase)
VALACALSGPNTCAEEGIASWYGKSLHGQVAASGEIYDAEALTAAHRTLPFGTHVRIRRVEGGDSVVVRINDRGPYSGERIIDLSEAAARRLGMTDPGVVKVVLEVLLPAGAAAFAVQAGTFRNPDNARRLLQALNALIGEARIVTYPAAPGLMCVVVGDGLMEPEARVLASRIQAACKECSGAYVVRLAGTSRVDR